MGFVSRKEDVQFLKKTPGRIIYVNQYILARREVFSLEVVLEWNTTPGSGAPESEINLALPSVKGNAFPDFPALFAISTSPVSGGFW